MERKMTTSNETIRTIDLGYEQMLIIEGSADARVRVLYGATWLTEEGEPGDEIVGADREVALHGGRTLIEGLEPTRLEIVQRADASSVWRTLQGLKRSLRSARRYFGRLQLGLAATEPNG
jgi:hypothetical protein